MREIRQSGLAGGRDRIAFGPPYPIIQLAPRVQENAPAGDQPERRIKSRPDQFVEE